MIDDLQYWHASEGQVSTSNERYKYGTSSLKWEWSSSACLTYTNPEYFQSLKWAPNKCLALWLFNDRRSANNNNEIQQPLHIEFLAVNDNQPLATVWFHVNFHGWRPLGLRYALLPQLKENFSRIHGVRFYASSDADHGIFYLNGLTFDYIHNTGPRPDYQQPWATPDFIQRLNDDPMDWLFDANNIFHHRPWLEPVNASEEDVKKIQTKLLKTIPYGTWSPSTKPESIDRLLEAASKYEITVDRSSNIPLGKGFYSPNNAMDIQPFLLGPLKRTATTFQCHRHRGTVDTDEGQQVWKLLLQLCDYLVEQGWSEGNGNIDGHLDIGYEIRNFPMCLVYIRESLNEVGRLQPMLLSAMWIMYGHLLIEERTSAMNTDVIHNYLNPLCRLIVCLPDQEELIRRLVAFRYMLTYCFENRIHEPLALDGTVHHHWMCHFSYASYTLPDILTLVSDVNDTEFRFSEHIRYILRRAVFALNFCLIEIDKIPPNLNARAGQSLSCNGLNMAKKCVCISDSTHSYDPFMAGILLNLCPKTDATVISYLNDGIDPIPLEGHLTLNSTAACVHRRQHFYVSIVGMGKHRRGLEIYGWLADANNYGEYSRNCSIFIVPPDENGLIKYSNSGCAAPGWNWSHWPGTTCLLRPRSELFQGYCNLTAKNWLAGGTSLADQDGMFSNDFFVWDVAFRRSVYCFDNRITVLTTNIKLLEQNKQPVITTLYQSNFSNLPDAEQTPLTINNEEKINDFPFERTYDNLTELTSVTDHRNLTYYLHPKENQNESIRLVFRRSQQEMVYCNQHYLNDPNDNPIIDMKSRKFKEAKFEDNEKFFKRTEDNYGLGYIEHMAVDDGTASFLYTILIGHTSLNDWTEQFAHSEIDPWNGDLDALPPSLVLSKTNDTHIFYDRDTDTTCYTCYSKDRLNVDTGLVRCFTQPCVAMVRGRGPGPIRASIATTDFMLNETLSLVLKGKWVDAELLSNDENGCVHVRSEILDDGDTKVTVWQRVYMPVEFLIHHSDN